ncbi:MAG: pyrimidine 5'-nucleotidase [Pelovirga sp.]
MKAILFDLDNTLYPAHCDLFSLIDVRINRYMEEIAGIALSQVDELRRRYWRDYGATLQGLIRHHAVDPEDYLDYVHAVDVTSRLTPDHLLRAILLSAELPCYVFTNGSRSHAERVLAALGLSDLFVEVFDIRIADYQPKPNPDPYRRVLDRLALAGDACVMVEDQLQNLKTAKDFGMTTVLVSATVAGQGRASYVDAQLQHLVEIAPLFETWQARARGG